jgi:hypothetical protein
VVHTGEERGSVRWVWGEVGREKRVDDSADLEKREDDRTRITLVLNSFPRE